MECVSSKQHLGSLLPQFETNTLSLLEVAWRMVQCGQRAVLKMSEALLCLVGNSNCLFFSPLLLGLKSTTAVPARCQGPQIFFFFKPKTAIQLHKESTSAGLSVAWFSVWIWLNTAHVWMDPGHHQGWSDTHIFQGWLHTFDVPTWCSELTATCPVCLLIRACIDHLH